MNPAPSIIKNINFSIAQTPVDLLIKRGNSTDLRHVALMASHKKHGVQYQVTRELSDELKDTQLKNIHPEHIRLTEPSIEFYFQDPQLPSAILSKFKLNQVIRDLFASQGLEAEDLNDPDDDYFFLLLHSSERQDISGEAGWNPKLPRFENALISQELSDGGLERALTGDLLEAPSDEGVTDPERKLITQMLQLCLKVLLYSQIDRYELEPLVRHKMREGKPGVKHRPERPSFTLRYLPHLHYARKATTTPNGIKVKGHERGHHMRILRSDRYTHKKGQVIFIAKYEVNGGYQDERPEERTVVRLANGL